MCVCGRLCSLQGCNAVWDGEISLRAPKSSPDESSAPTQACGGSVPCAVPADVCAPGWEVCLSDPAGGVDLGLFRAGITQAQCDSGASGTYVSAMSHANQPCPATPVRHCPAQCPPF